MKKYFIFLVIFLTHILTYGQDEKVRLAFQYYQEKEYQKASVLFGELFDQSNAQVYYSYALTCLIEIKDYPQAEKMIKKQIRKNKTDLLNYIEYGYLYKKQGKEKESIEQYDYVLKNLTGDKNDLIRLANNFIMKREYEFAQKVYEKGGKLINYGFHLEIANIYAFQRKSQEMVDEYLNLIKEEPAQTVMVQNSLQSRLTSSFDENLGEILKKALIKRIQKDPKDIIYNEMLLWYYTQRSDYTNAIIQAKALDRRLNEGGMRLIELGGIAKTSNMFTEAKDAYEYVLSRGKESSYYFEAKLGYLDVLSEQLEAGQIVDQSELQKMEILYKETINEFGAQPETIKLIKDLAHLQAFYLNKTNDAKKILLDAIQNKKLNTSIKGSCKIELGDIYLLCGQTSDAILEYAQAAKMNEENENGDNAKFKRATLAFYTGNFIWAQAQLDVLKASTSKLIANDAFVLSMLISDNLGQDTTEKALSYYARAEMLLEQKRPDEALNVLDTLELNYKTNSLIDDVLFLKSKIYEKQGKLDKAIQSLQMIADNYPSDLLGDDAIYRLAQIYDYQLDDKKKAIEYYKKIIFNYPGSIYVIDARKRFRILRGDNEGKTEQVF